MIRTILVIAVMALFAATPLRAEVADCGFPPTVSPEIPDGATASREDITAAVSAVKVYGAAVNVFLDCQEEAKKELFLVLSRPQQERWGEDFNALVDRLTLVEMALNDQIRIYNARD